MPFHRILIVDDDAASARQLASTLGCLGYHVEVVDDGRAALQRARIERFDVGIVSDRLGETDGTCLFAELAPFQRSMTGMLLAGQGNLNSVWKAVNAGMTRVITRPVDFDQLVMLVEACHESHHKRLNSEAPMSGYDEHTIAELSSEEIRYTLTQEELVSLIRSVDYPFAGKDRLQFFDRDTLERIAHLVRRWCQSRCCVVPN